MSKKLDVHLIVQDFLRVAERLGFSPSRDQYMADPDRKFSKDEITGMFGSWLGLVRAAGFKPSPQARDKLNKQDVRKRYYEHLLKEVERLRTEVVEHKPSQRLLVLGDLHTPYMHQDYPAFLIALHAHYKFDRVCSVGDEVDHHAISFHESDPDLLSPGHELKAAINALTPLYEAFPEMDVCESNHGSLHFRKGKHAGLPRQLIAAYHDALQAPPGWRWKPEIKVDLSDGSHCVIHHALSADVLRSSQGRGESMIFGHHHSLAGVWWWNNGKRKLFASFTGCGIDDKALAFSYNTLQLKRPIMGCTIVFNGVARWIPMLLDSSGRWIKQVP